MKKLIVILILASTAFAESRRPTVVYRRPYNSRSYGYRGSDRVLAGAVIGTAVGIVIGVAAASGNGDKTPKRVRRAEEQNDLLKLENEKLRIEIDNERLRQEYERVRNSK